MARPIRKPLKLNPEQKEAAFEELLVWISNGGMLREFCRQEGKPSYDVMYDWVNAEPERERRFAHARKKGFDAIAQQCLVIADTTHEGEVTRITDKGVEVTKEDMLGHRKLQIETRLKLLAKWDPGRYGDRQVLAGDKENPLEVNGCVLIPAKKADE